MRCPIRAGDNTVGKLDRITVHELETECDKKKSAWWLWSVRHEWSGLTRSLRRCGGAAVVVAPLLARELQSAACVRAVKVSRAGCVRHRPRPRRPARPPRCTCRRWARAAWRPTCTSPSPRPRAPAAPRPACAASAPNSTGGLHFQHVKLFVPSS